jgi:hypothetical protein
MIYHHNIIRYCKSIRDNGSPLQIEFWDPTIHDTAFSIEGQQIMQKVTKIV